MRWVLMPAVALALALATVETQEKKPRTETRTVIGTVVDKENRPAGSAEIYCRKLRQGTVRVKRADADGRFQLLWLEAGVDYEIHARHGKWVSAKVLLSGTDLRKEIHVTLKLDQEGIRPGLRPPVAVLHWSLSLPGVE
jgi:hypothetical protein